MAHSVPPLFFFFILSHSRNSADTSHCDINQLCNPVNLPETKETSAILAEAEGGLDSSGDASSTGGLMGLCGQDTQPGCRASEALQWVWEYGGTSWQQAPCISLQCPLL